MLLVQNNLVLYHHYRKMTSNLSSHLENGLSTQKSNRMTAKITQIKFAEMRCFLFTVDADGSHLDNMLITKIATTQLNVVIKKC